MIAWTLAVAATLSAAVPAAMFWANRRLFLPPAEVPAAGTRRDSVNRKGTPQVSVLIPARDEERAIRGAVESALRSEGIRVEVIVLDDHSSDATESIVREMAERDTRVAVVRGEELPPGWNGKQYACYQLAKHAAAERLLFIDADVRLRPDAVARLCAYRDRSGAALVSAFPHQETGTWLEKWLIPMMHFILLGFLPMARMRQSDSPAYAAGCGQLFLTGARQYRQAGTHEAIRDSRHDGLKLPAAYRRAGMMSDIVDGTPIASCRMYRGAGEVVRGLLKNASEGIAKPQLIIPFSVILLGSSVLPWVAVGVAVWEAVYPALALSFVAVVLGHLPRALAAAQFRQPVQGVIFHSLAVLIFVAIQWIALINHLAGRKVAWRGRR